MPKGYKHAKLKKIGGSNGELPPRQQLFVKTYIANGFNAGAAALAAGYSPHTAPQIAGRLLATPTVMAAVEEGKKKLFRKYDVSAERVVQELALLGFSNMQDYMEVTEDGAARLDLSNLTRDQAAAISQLDSEVYMEGHGEDAEQVKRTRIRLHDKRAPLELLGKHLGIFEGDGERREIQVRVFMDGNKTGVAVGVKD